MQYCFLCFDIRFLKTPKRQPESQDAPNKDTWGIMVTTIQLKLSRSRGWGGTIADKDEDKDAEKDAEKDADEKKDLMKDNSV